MRAALQIGSVSTHQLRIWPPTVKRSIYFNHKILSLVRAQLHCHHIYSWASLLPSCRTHAFAAATCIEILPMSNKACPPASHDGLRWPKWSVTTLGSSTTNKYGYQGSKKRLRICVSANFSPDKPRCSAIFRSGGSRAYFSREVNEIFLRVNHYNSYFYIQSLA